MEPPQDVRLRSLAVALLCVASVASWQALTVHFTYGGNWTGLFCTGSLPPGPPPQLRERLYFFSGGGYDGQFYHYIAHDPFLRRGFSASIDMPRYRYRRILVPLVAYLLAFGDDRRVDAAYFAVVWIFTGIGAYWLALFASRCGYPVWIGLFFVLVPGVLISIDRLTVDIALAACVVGFVLYLDESRWKLWLVLAAAALARETGLLLILACVVSAAATRRFRRAAVLSTAALPFLCWSFLIRSRTPEMDMRPGWPEPFGGLLARIFHPVAYPGYAPAIARWIQAADLLALAGIVAMLVWAARQAFRRAWTPLDIAVYGFALLALGNSLGGVWTEVYGFGRTFTPLVLLPALQGLRGGAWTAAWAMFALDPRIALQMGGQIANVARGIAG